jgi:hypothetical protein
MQKTAKLVTALTLAGLAFAGSTAFTGAGLSSVAGPSQFIGGTVTQTVTGATLNSLAYGFTAGDNTKTQVETVTLTFAAGSEGKAVGLTLDATGGATFTCPAIDVSNASVCVIVPAPDTFVTNVTKATVTVS